MKHLERQRFYAITVVLLISAYNVGARQAGAAQDLPNNVNDGLIEQVHCQTETSQTSCPTYTFERALEDETIGPLARLGLVTESPFEACGRLRPLSISAAPSQGKQAQYDLMDQLNLEQQLQKGFDLPGKSIVGCIPRNVPAHGALGGIAEYYTDLHRIEQGMVQTMNSLSNVQNQRGQAEFFPTELGDCEEFKTLPQVYENCQFLRDPRSSCERGSLQGTAQIFVGTTTTKHALEAAIEDIENDTSRPEDDRLVMINQKQLQIEGLGVTNDEINDSRIKDAVLSELVKYNNRHGLSNTLEETYTDDELHGDFVRDASHGIVDAVETHLNEKAVALRERWEELRLAHECLTGVSKDACDNMAATMETLPAPMIEVPNVAEYIHGASCREGVRQHHAFRANLAGEAGAIALSMVATGGLGVVARGAYTTYRVARWLNTSAKVVQRSAHLARMGVLGAYTLYNANEAVDACTSSYVKQLELAANQPPACPVKGTPNYTRIESDRLGCYESVGGTILGMVGIGWTSRSTLRLADRLLPKKFKTLLEARRARKAAKACKMPTGAKANAMYKRIRPGLAGVITTAMFYGHNSDKEFDPALAATLSYEVGLSVLGQKIAKIAEAVPLGQVGRLATRYGLASGVDITNTLAIYPNFYGWAEDLSTEDKKRLLGKLEKNPQFPLMVETILRYIPREKVEAAALRFYERGDFDEQELAHPVEALASRAHLLHDPVMIDLASEGLKNRVKAQYKGASADVAVFKRAIAAGTIPIAFGTDKLIDGLFCMMGGNKAIAAATGLFTAREVATWGAILGARSSLE